MHPLTTFLVLVCFVAYFGNVSAKIGDFADHNGYKCSFGVSKVGHCRELHIKCNKKQKNNLPNLNYNCIYSGDPHNCKAYNKDKTNKLNWGYVNILKKNAGGACFPASVTMDKMCSGVVYNKGACHSRTVLEEIIFKEIEYNGY